MSEGTKRLPQYLIAMAVNLIMVTIGLTLAWPSPGIPKLMDADKSPLPEVITEEEASWVGSAVAIGAIFGPFPAGFGCDRMGRKTTLLLSGLPFIIGWFIVGTTCNTFQIYVSRFLMGLGVGAGFTAMPIYVGEIAETAIRGALGSFVQLFVSIGLLMAYGIGPFINFAWLAFVCFIAPVVYMLVYMFCPESPVYFLAVGKKEDAKKSLKTLRGVDTDVIDKELDTMQRDVEEAMRNKGSFKEIVTNRGNRKALLIVLALMGGQQLAGITVILFYTQTIFEKAGATIRADISAIIIGVVQLIASAITPLIVERLGRKFLLVFSAAGMALSHFAIAFFFIVKDSGSDVTSIGVIPIASLMMYITVFALGYGPLPWAIMGELFPANIKSPASVACTSFCWFMCFAVTKSFVNISGLIGDGGSFLIFGVCCILNIVFVVIFVPETKGRTNQEIQELLNG